MNLKIIYNAIIVVLHKEIKMSSSILTSKFQITIPQDIREILKLKAGDQIIFEITKDKKVCLRKATPKEIAYLRSLESTLMEWNSESDSEDFCDL